MFQTGGLFPSDAENEHNNFSAALAKCKNVHDHLSTLQLNTVEASMCVPSADSFAHKQVIAKIGAYNLSLVQQISAYSTITMTHTIPGLQEPTTAEQLRKRVVQDFGVIALKAQPYEV